MLHDFNTWICRSYARFCSCGPRFLGLGLTEASALSGTIELQGSKFAVWVTIQKISFLLRLAFLVRDINAHSAWSSSGPAISSPKTYPV